MLLDLNQVFLTMDGHIMQDVRQVEDGKDKDGKVKFKEESKDLTLGRILSLALIEPVHKIVEGDKEKYFELALKLNTAKAGIVELASEEITTLKTAVRPKYGIVLVGEALRMLEGKDIGIEIVVDEKKESESEESRKINEQIVIEREAAEKIDPPEGIEPDKPDLANPM